MGARWIDFAEELCICFGEKNITDVIEEFNKLRQEGTVTEYQEKFEELGCWYGVLNPPSRISTLFLALLVALGMN